MLNRPELQRRLKMMFQITADHFNLTADERRSAWESAQIEPARALVCYSAIARSIKPRRKT